MKRFGTFVELGGANVMECLAGTGLDYVILDAEHGPFSPESAAEMLRAAENRGLTVYVRIGSVTRPEVLRMLDVGARGLVVPCIRSVGQVKELVDHAKFPPVGRRGYCPTRTSAWGAVAWSSDAESYMAECNRRVRVIPQCETKEALEHIAEIAALPGVDAVFIGPCDLSIDMGIPLQFDNSLLLDAIRRIISACHANGKECLIFAGSLKDAKKWLDFGADSIAYSLDAAVLSAAYRQATADFRALADA